jgi:hypothetical protein
MGFTYFHDLPVYRLDADAYYRDRDAYVEKSLFPPGTMQEENVRRMEALDPNSLIPWRSSLHRFYGGCWEFNEIVGYIRLHILGNQVRGEYYATGKKRIVRSRRKMFEFRTWKLVTEGFIERPYGDAEVLSAVMDYVARCREALPRRHIDSSVLEAIAPHVRWSKLVSEGAG